MKYTKLITVSQEPLPKIFSVFDTEGITLEAYQYYEGALPATLQFSRESRSRGSIHHNRVPNMKRTWQKTFRMRALATVLADLLWMGIISAKRVSKSTTTKTAITIVGGFRAKGTLDIHCDFLPRLLWL